MNPKARTENLVVESVDDELVIYDEDRKTAHRLNALAVRVWKACDGQTSVDAIAESVDLDSGDDNARAAVSVVLRDLEEAGLLVPGSAPAEAAEDGLSRRRALALAAGVGAALLVSTVSSLTAPTPAMASSPGGGDVDIID